MAFKFLIDYVDKRIEKTIEEIFDVNDKNLTSLGVASGMNLWHCLYIASRHCKTTDDFLNNVQYYRVCSKDESLDPRFAITIEFYQ